MRANVRFTFILWKQRDWQTKKSKHKQFDIQTIKKLASQKLFQNHGNVAHLEKVDLFSVFLLVYSAKTQFIQFRTL